MARKVVLVTGGAGFIGSNFVRYIYEKYPEYKIIVLDALTYAGSVDNFPSGSECDERFEFWYGNVLNADLVSTLVSRSSVVIHFAAETHVTRSIFDNRLFFETDVIGTQNVASAVSRFADQMELFIHVSTSEVYGTAVSETIDEDHPLNPMSPYAAAKCGADRLVYSYQQTYGIPAVIVRPFNNYGPRQHLEKVVPRFVTSCLENEPLRVHGDGLAMRDFLYVEDHCDALDRIMHAKRDSVIGEVINLGYGESINILGLAEKIHSLVDGCNSEIEFIGNRPGQVIRHTCDSSKAYSVLGWKPKTCLNDGITSTIEWYYNNIEWWRKQSWLREIPIITASGKKELH